MKYVLFSPIGTSDPIRGDYDGPLLHIVRHYKPKKVYLFLTKEMAERDREKDIYAWILRKLQADIIVEKFYHDEIDNPQVADAFDECYRADIEKVIADNQDCTVIANATSGTPQMMAALRLFAAKTELPIKLICVDTPQNKENTSPPVGKDYDKESAWENNLDNLVDACVENRCHELRDDNIRKALVTEVMVKYLQVYDYAAALTVFAEARNFFPQKLEHALKGAFHRLRLEYDLSEKQFNAAAIDCKEIYPVQSGDNRKVFEYLLRLKKLGDSGALLEFAQGFSPIFFRLCVDCLKKNLSVDIQKFTENKKGILKYALNKLPQEYKAELDKEFEKKGGFKGGNVYSSNLLPIIALECRKNSQMDLYKVFDDLRKFEEQIRNIAAHEITPVSEDTFKSHGMMYAHIFDKLKKLYSQIYRTSADWKSYDNMNEKIRMFIR